MEYRRLGKSGLRLSALSFGSWVTFGEQADVDLAYRMMARAYEAGINFFDNAETYANGESEQIMGEALKRAGWTRDSYCVSSKVFWGGKKPTQMGLSRKHVTEACHAALKRLQVDYLDLYFCHRPDVDTPIEETVRAMDTLIQQGKVLYWGTSEWSAQQLAEAFAVAREHHLTPPTMEQPQYNLFERQKVELEFLPIYEHGLGTTIWSPLASGVLSGKYANGFPSDARLNLPGYEWLKDKWQSVEGRARIEKVSRLGKLAGELGMSSPQLAIAWCLKNPRVSTVILGASKLSQLEDNLKSIDSLAAMTPEVLEQIEQIVGTRPPAPTDWKK